METRKMVKQGGYSYNTNSSKKGIKDRGGSCKHCGRRYKQNWTLDRHQKLCEEYHESNKEK